MLDANTEGVDDRYPKMESIFWNLYIMRKFGLHHYKEKLTESFFPVYYLL